MFDNIISKEKQVEIDCLCNIIKIKVLLYCGIKNKDTLISLKYDSILKRISQSFWVPSKRVYNILCCNSDTLLMFNDTEINDHMNFEFGRVIDVSFIEHLVDLGISDGKSYSSDSLKVKAIIEVNKIVNSEILNHIKHNYQSFGSTISVTPFNKFRGITNDDGNVVINLPFKYYKFLDGDISNNEIVDDYKEHFVEFDDYLTRIAMSWFDPNCKSSYTWIKGISNAGKSLLNEGVLASCGILTSLSFADYVRILKGNPSGVNVSKFIYSAGVFIDEYEEATKQDMGSQMTLSINVKNGPLVKVDRRSTIVANKEDIAGLITEYGVESQYENRFCQLTINGNILNRDIFIKYGAASYKSALRVYSVNYINDVISKMISIGKCEAERKASIYNISHHNKYGISNDNGSISDSYDEIALDCVEWIVNNKHNEKVKANLVISGNQRDPIYYLKSPKTVIKEFLKSKMTIEEFNVYKKESSCILELMKKGGSSNNYGTDVKKVFGRSIKCIELSNPNISYSVVNDNVEYMETSFGINRVR